jgi:hypothetical protein
MGGSNAKYMWETYVVCKKSAEFMNAEWGAGDARGGEVITKRIQLEMKQKGRIRDDGRDVLYMCVSELGMNY